MEDKVNKKVDESWKEKAKVEPKQEEPKQEEPKLEPDTKQNQKPTDDSTPMPEADFKFFLSSLGMQAWIALGLLPNPMTEKTEENLQQAKFIIDTLVVLQEKTKGNLTQEEGKLMEGLLYELRLAFVEKSKNKS